jgi:DNA-binding GntR family transcriptional regulator
MRASDRAYHALRGDIVEWKLPPGSVLGEVEQSARLGISRTPLREALSRLAAEGLTAQSGRGAVVTDVSRERTRELFEARQALECRTAALAAERRSPEVFARLRDSFETAETQLGTGDDPLHRGYYALVDELDAAIDAAAANAFLVQAQQRLRVQLVRIRRLARDNPARLRASAAEHRLISSAIAAGNPDLAAAATQVHLHNSLDYLLSTGILSGDTSLTAYPHAADPASSKGPTRG